MKLLLAGNWPPLKPLPVFKYESPAYRASIEFDKARGEWVCRKTFLPSNNVQEVRGGLAEVVRSLPDSPAGAFAEFPRTQQQKPELDREACRRLQTILEWKVNFENGALYSELQNYLFESQQQEIDDILRLTLTARQLQFSPKNVACVFDALSKAGGRLATLLELARRNKTQQAEDPAAKEESSAPGAVLQSPPVPTSIPATVENSPEEQMGNVVPEQDRSSSPEPAVHSVPQASEIAPQKIPEVNPSSFGEEHREKVHERAPVPGDRPQVRTRKVEWSANYVEKPPSRQRALEISGRHIAAFAVVFLFAVISLPIGLTVGRGPLGQWFRDAQQSLFAAHSEPPASPAHPVETPSRSSALPSLLPVADSASGTTSPDAVAPPDEKSGKSARDFESSTKVSPTISNSPPATESKPPIHTDAIPGRDGATGLIARVSPPLASPTPAHPLSAADTARGAWRKSAPLRVAPSMSASPYRSTPSGILVTPPAHGSKPFRVSFPEKTIAASSSIAITSELSVLVPPDPGPEAAYKSSRLQTGELVSFVWPRYSRQGARYGAAEIVRVRATIGQLGQVRDIKLLSGSAALFPATMNAIRQWRYKPTFLNKRPIPVQQDITIEFRPPQYLSQARTRHSGHN